MSELTNADSIEVESAIKARDDHTKTLSDVTASRWTAHGHDRIYVNGLFSTTTDVYVELSDETATVSGTKTRGQTVSIEDGAATLTIKRPSSTYEVVLSAATDEDEIGTDDDTDDSDDNGPDLERFGVDI